MVNLQKVVFLSVVFCLWLASSAQAALDLSEIGVGARPMGLGRAYVALADDASAIFLNPAGLARNNTLNLISMGGVMLNDVNYVMLGGADYSPLGKIGVGFINASVGTIPLTTVTGSGSTEAISQYGLTDYSSSQIVFSYGSKVSRFFRGKFGHNLAVGANLKFMLQGFSGGGSAMQDAAGGGMDADLGFLWDANRWLAVGLNFQNLLPTSFGGKFVWRERNGAAAVVEGIPLVTRVGCQVKLLGLQAMKKSLDQRLELMADYEKSSDQSLPGVIHAGAEFWPMEMLAVRAGVDQKPRATSSGTSIDSNLTFGLGLNLAGFTFDYAYHRFGELNENATHFFSLGYKGEEPIKEREKKRADRKRSTVPVPEVVSKPLLKTFSDVPEVYWAQKPISYISTLGIMGGYPDGTFKPTKEITRGELAVILIRAKELTISAEGIKRTFKDVSLNDQLAPFISLAVEKNYLSGYPDETFKPKQVVTRAEIAVIITQVSGAYVKSQVSQKPFVDVPTSHWAAPAIAAAKDLGCFAYLSGQAFGPDMPVTRAEVAEIISKTPFIKRKIEDLLAGENEGESGE